jgi:hypothetical protein
VAHAKKQLVPVIIVLRRKMYRSNCEIRGNAVNNSGKGRSLTALKDGDKVATLFVCFAALLLCMDVLFIYYLKTRVVSSRAATARDI